MPQVSLYLNEKTYAKVRRAAESESESVSKWISRKLDRTLSTQWPDGFEKLFGSISDDSFEAPARHTDTFAADAARENL